MAKQLVIQSGGFGPRAVLYSSEQTHRDCHKHLALVIIVFFVRSSQLLLRYCSPNNRTTFVLRNGLRGNPAFFWFHDQKLRKK